MYSVNRHTGGLEIQAAIRRLFRYVNRHTGGLEKTVDSAMIMSVVNRHTGGLETARATLPYQQQR